jgi:hypothetical protein
MVISILTWFQCPALPPGSNALRWNRLPSAPRYRYSQSQDLFCNLIIVIILVNLSTGFTLVHVIQAGMPRLIEVGMDG